MTSSSIRDALLHMEHPGRLRFETAERPDELVAELKLYDIEYRGLFLWFVPLKSYDVYRMRLRLGPATSTVLLQDERETYLKTWTKLRQDSFRGVYESAREVDKLWGRRADGSLGELYRYTFDSEELKEPVRRLVARHGWKLVERRFC